MKIPSLAFCAAVLAAGCVGDTGSGDEAAISPALSGGGTFGQPGTGTSFAGMSANGKRASEFTLSDSSVTVTQLTAYLDGRGATSGSQVGRGVIYAADATGGAPGTLLCETAEFSIAAGQAPSWINMAMSGTCKLASSGKYYLGIHTGGPTAGVARYGSYAVTGALHWSLNDSYSDGPSNPWGTDSLGDAQMAIYATYQGPPTVAETIANAATVSGSITWSASTSGLPAPAYVNFVVDGTKVDTRNAPSPYCYLGATVCKYDTTSLANGSHTFLVGSHAADGTLLATVTASVTVSNAGGGGTGTYDAAVSYTQTRPPFTPLRTVNVTSGAELKSAVANLKAGDLVLATADFTLTSSSGDTLTISARLSSPAVIDLSQHVVKIVYNGTGLGNAVTIKNAENLRIYGGDVSSDPSDGLYGDACIGWWASQYVTWWGFKAHDCGADGVRMFTGKSGYSFTGPVQHDDVEGDISRINYNAVNTDPHAEICTGVHGMNLVDGNYFDVSNNRIALNVHDVTCSGGGIEFGTAYSSPMPHDNTIILQCTNFSFISTQQTGGNCFQTWGYGTGPNTRFPFINASNLTGHAYWAGGMYSAAGSALTGTTVVYGRAANTNKNPRYVNDPIWDKRAGTVFEDVLPTP